MRKKERQPIKDCPIGIEKMFYQMFAITKVRIFFGKEVKNE